MGAYEQLIYLLIFSSIVYLIYMVFVKKYRYLVLLVFSLGIFLFVSRFMTILMLASTLIVYLFAYFIGKRNKNLKLQKETLTKDEYKALKKKVQKVNKRLLILGVILNLSLLIGFKYINFFDSILNTIFSWFHADLSIPMFKILLPLGISYYTLANTGYLIDVYRNKYEASTNYLDVLLFTCYFPCLLEGPISHYDILLPQLKQPHSFNKEDAKKGLLIILIGLFKKLVIADRFAIFVTNIFGLNVKGPMLILGILCFTIQLYCEFSGIIDIVRGVSLMYSIKLEKNFEQPFFSSSVSEFWRRWHISLGAWFRDYVFYPVSMSRPLMALRRKLSGKVSTFFETFIPSCIVLFVIWSLTGLWHGASVKYLVYGLYYYLIMVFELIIDRFISHETNQKKGVKITRMILTFFFVNIGMILFRCNTLTDFGNYIANIFRHSNYRFTEVFEISELIIGFVMIIGLLVIEGFQNHKVDIYQKYQSFPAVCRYLLAVGLVFIIVIFGVYGAGYLPPDPIYGGF